jgi:hypothetical protein
MAMGWVELVVLALVLVLAAGHPLSSECLRNFARPAWTPRNPTSIRAGTLLHQGWQEYAPCP